MPAGCGPMAGPAIGPGRPLETAISTPKSTAAARLQQGPHICFGMLLRGGRDDANWRFAAPTGIPQAFAGRSQPTTPAVPPVTRRRAGAPVRFAPACALAAGLSGAIGSPPN